MAHYLVSPLAEQDIESIGDYIALDNPHRAFPLFATRRLSVSVIPAKAGIQLIDTSHVVGQHTTVALSATRNCITSWIPAFAGMTVFENRGVMNYGKINNA